MTFSSEQLNTIETDGRRLLVSAAAGSGKTAVLVERVIRKILNDENPVDVDRFLVMTFTKAAASEMKERIRDRLSKELDGLDSKSEKAIRLRNQITQADSAYIMTIDSFCMSVIRDHSDALDIDPAFRVADEAELTLLREDVLEEMLEEYYAEADEKFIAFAECYTSGGRAVGLEDIIKNIYAFAQANPWPEKWYERCADECGKDGQDTEYIKYIFSSLKELLVTIKQKLMSALRICECEGGPDVYIPMLESDTMQLEHMLKADSFAGLISRVDAYTPETLSRKKSSDPELRETVKKIRDSAKESISGISKQFGSVCEDDTVSEHIHTILNLAKEFDRRYSEKKRRKNIIDFNDIEHFALQILYGNDAIAEEYRDRFEEIYIDEYQDSNAVQQALVDVIEKGNVFMVGDVKQSIYGFRLADPGIFNAKYHSYVPFGSSEEKDDTLIELSKNYRSRAGVVGTVNDVFRSIMTKSLGGVDYDKSAELNYAADYKDIPESLQGSVPAETQLMLVDIKDTDSDESKRVSEARMIADKIKELTDEENGLIVWDKSAGCYRRAQYKDIAILMRSTAGAGSIVMNTLMDLGIPAYTSASRGYFESAEIDFISSLLEAIDNPYKDIPLMAYLHSPVIGMTDEEIALWIGDKRRGEYRSLYSLMLESDNPKLQHASRKLSEYRDKSGYMDVAEFLLFIYRDTGYYDYARALPSGSVRALNLDMLSGLAKSYCTSGYKGLYNFIRYINNLKTYDADFGEASSVSEYDNLVRIMTIHKSKGLEFPVVFVAATDAVFSSRDITGKVLIDKDFGAALDYVDTEKRLSRTTLKKAVVRYKKKNDQLGEELRILYVAMTRAREQLYLTAAVNDADKIRTEWSACSAASDDNDTILLTDLMSANSYLKWILLSQNRTNIGLSVVDADSFTVSDIKEIMTDAEKTDYLNKLSIDDGKKKEYDELFGYEYPYQADISLRNKISISELKVMGQNIDEEKTEIVYTDVDAFPDKRNAGIAENGPSESGAQRGTSDGGAQRGTLYHEYMKNLDYKLPAEPEAPVRKRDIDEWLSSDIGKRVSAAFTKGTLRREKQFIMTMTAKELGLAESEEPVLVQGIIDAYFEEDDGLVLVDYKTDRVSTGDELIKKYEKQLFYYAIALEKIHNKPVKEKIIWSFTLGRGFNL